MKKILALLLIICISSCKNFKPSGYKCIDLNELQDKEAVVVDKKVRAGAYGAIIIQIYVSINNDTAIIIGATREEFLYIYNNFELGDTIKYRKEFGK